MAFEALNQQGSGERAPTLYFGYKEPDNVKENWRKIKKDQPIEGYFLKSYETESKVYKSMQWHHVLVTPEGVHQVIPGSVDIDTTFLDHTEKGALTRFTYLGKKTFARKDGSPGSAYKALIEQDKSNTCTWEGDSFTAKPVLGGKPVDTDVSATKTTPTESFTADDLPF